MVVLAPSDGPTPGGVVSLGRTVGVPANGSIAPVAPHPAAALRTLRLLSRGRFDVVHLHEPLVPGPCLSALALARHPLVGTFHRSGRSAAYTALGPPARLVLRRLDARCAVSVQAAETARAQLGGDYQLVFNGVDEGGFSAAVPAATRGPTIVFIGRHEPRKGLGLLLEAYRRLPPGTALWVLGSGPQTARMREEAKDLPAVEWLGRVGEAEKASRLKAADILCAPSIAGESFGMVLLEGMAAGCVVVASDIPGYRSVATDGADALLVAPGDPVALAGALGRALADPELAGRLRSAGREVARACSLERLAAEYEVIYAGGHG